MTKKKFQINYQQSSGSIWATEYFKSSEIKSVKEWIALLIDRGYYFELYVKGERVNYQDYFRSIGA